MLIIPEIETVVVLVPRTGSGTLRRAIVARYPKSMLIYRHMEACGVPAGYDRWPKVGVVRDPVERLWSLYKFTANFSGDHDPAFIESMRQSAARPFDDWLLHNQTVFTQPYDSANRGRYWPQFTVRHPLPENRKSQFVYLRPDLGTQVFRYDEVGALAARLGVTLVDRQNATAPSSPPPLSADGRDYIERAMAWDIEATRAAKKAA